MRVSPTFVTRVFMLFRGVPPGVSLAARRPIAQSCATFWTKVVGVDAVRCKRSPPAPEC